MAVNMMDLVKKNGDKIDIKNLSNALGCEVVEISALKGTGIDEVKEKQLRQHRRKYRISVYIASIRLLKTQSTA